MQIPVVAQRMQIPVVAQRRQMVQPPETVPPFAQMGIGQDVFLAIEPLLAEPSYVM